jgi:hypothetical protein
MAVQQQIGAGVVPPPLSQLIALNVEYKYV